MARGQDVDENGNPIDQPDTGSPNPNQPNTSGITAYSLAYTLPNGTVVYQDKNGRYFTNDDMGPHGQSPQGQWHPYEGDVPNTPPTSTRPGAAGNPGVPDSPPTTTPPTTTPPPSGGGGGAMPSGDFVPPPPGWDRNTWEASQPGFNAPTYTPPPAFAAPAYTAPDYAAALNDPGYRFEADQGTKALQASAAARGVLNGGGTLKDINQWGQNYATTRVNDVSTRAMDAYKLNYDTAAGVYNTNYQTQYADPYKYAYQSALDAFTGNLSAWQTKGQIGQHQNEIDWTHAYTPWNDQWNRRIIVGTS